MYEICVYMLLDADCVFFQKLSAGYIFFQKLNADSVFYPAVMGELALACSSLLLTLVAMDG
jgi:hypothetical protein